MAGRGRSLSDLPDDVIEEILCRLPIKNAVRTSVLSGYWRERWLSIPELDLSGLYCSQIYKIVLSHSRPLCLFKVKEPEQDGHPAEPWRSHDVEIWLTTLSLQSASSLRTLCLLLNKLTCDLNLISNSFTHLTHLELSGHLSVPLQFQGFTSLRGLHLHHFRPLSLSEHDVNGLSKLISSCPLLENLVLFYTDCEEDPYFSLDINAPNLRQLHLDLVELYDFSVTSAPLLEYARMDDIFYIEREDDDNGGGIVDCPLTKVLREMVSIKILEVDYTVLEFLGRGHVPERISLCFHNLRIVTLMNVSFGDEKQMLVLICLLRSCPNLLELVKDQTYYPNENEPYHDVWNMQAQEDVALFYNLETVIMTQIMCTRPELRFIKFVLAKAKALKSVEISLHEEVKNMDAIVADLSEFPRVSNQAQILLTRHVPFAHVAEQDANTG